MFFIVGFYFLFFNNQFFLFEFDIASQSKGYATQNRENGKETPRIFRGKML